MLYMIYYFQVNVYKTLGLVEMFRVYSINVTQIKAKLAYPQYVVERYKITLYKILTFNSIQFSFINILFIKK
jgi:hypothetical protein